ncbi:MAG: sugar ABC transporter permease [Mycobacteriales bacterium]
MTTTQSAADLDPRLLVDEQGLKGYVTAFRRRVTGGELGSLPVVVGLVVIWAIFYFKESRFLSAQNLTNLSLQMCATGLISVGIVMVLLLGEVDLSVGSVSGLTAAVMATQIFRHDTDQYVAMLLALLVGAIIGAFHGTVFAKFGVPSFVVTLAGLIAWQGAQLRVLGSDGTVTLPSGPVQSLTSAFYPHATGWVLAVVGLVLYAGAQLWEVRTRTRAGLRPRPMVEIAFRVVVVAAALAVAVSVLNHYRGVPFALVLFLVVVVVFDLMIRRTRYGRHVLAVGGNIEAARRAGIGVSFIRISVFSIAGVMAAAGGLVAASRISSVSQSSGGSDTLLNAIAAAVIGGTSLFGGRGSSYSALLGILVIQSIANGMALLGLESSTQFMITGGVLLAAVTIDALGRRGRAASGRG